MIIDSMIKITYLLVALLGLTLAQTVISSHANEPATISGKVQKGTNTAAFISARKVDMVVPLSGNTMSYNGAGKCTSGC
jgi:hypothetical protein